MYVLDTGKGTLMYIEKSGLINISTCMKQSKMKLALLFRFPFAAIARNESNVTPFTGLSVELMTHYRQTQQKYSVQSDVNGTVLFRLQ